MQRVLLIDDDEGLATPLASYLARFDIELHSALKPSLGLQRLADEAFDAVILDVMLPEMDGFELCREIRRHSLMPILMLSARGEVTDRVVGLELGADDYLPKPFEPRELAARLQTIMRRTRGSSDHAKRLVIDLERRSVTRQGADISLTGTEFELLVMLAREPQKVFSRDQILNQLRGHEADLYSRAVDILVSRLRKKLEPLDCIKTLRNAGYAFAGARR
jgi:two-component system, OmpR family, response regulator